MCAPPADYGADIVVGSMQPLGVHMNCGGGAGGFIATRDEERYAREYPTLILSASPRRSSRRVRLRHRLFEQTSYGMREDGNDWTGNSVYLWAVANAAYMALMGPRGLPRDRRADPRAATTRRGAWPRSTASRSSSPTASSRSSSSTSTTPAGRSPRSTGAARARDLRRQGPVGRLPGARTERPLLRDGGAHARRTSTGCAARAMEWSHEGSACGATTRPSGTSRS